MLVTLTLKTVLYENGKPFAKEWDVIVLCESIISNVDTYVTMVMEFAQSCLKRRNGRENLKVSRWLEFKSEGVS